MENDYIRYSKRKAWPICGILLLSLLFFGAAAYCIAYATHHVALELELLGGKELQVEYGEQFHDPGYRVVLRGDDFFTNGIEIDINAIATGQVTDEKLGRYVINYCVRWMGMEADAVRLVQVVDTVQPTITLVPDSPDLQPTPQYQEAGFSAFDNYDGDITAQVKRVEELGKVTYTVMDSSGNLAFK